VSTDANAVPGNYAVLISKLATGTLVRSPGAIGADIISSDKLSALNLSAGVTTGSFSINGVSIAVDRDVDTLDDVVARINASGAGVTASLQTVDGRARFSLNANTPGGAIQLGSAGDSSNFLSSMKVLAAPRSGDAITGTGSLGVTQTGEMLVNARLATSVSGTGTLTINGVDVTYNADTDSLATVMSRINASAAGVTASYDAVHDRFILQNKQTGSVTIGLADTGNLLAALGVNDPASQTLGSNAEYSVDGGVTTRYSASNTVTDAMPGVRLTLTATSTTPVTFSVSPDTDAAVSAIKKFVEQYNSTASFIRDKLSYDATTKKAGQLLGDSGARLLDQTLRSMVTRAGSGISGQLQTLADVGISFGSYGAAVGSTKLLQVDETRLRNALQANPQAVQQLFGADKTTATLSSAGDIAAISGSPKDLASAGTFAVTSNGSGSFTATFYDANGRVQTTKTETIAAGQRSDTLIPGLTITAATSLTGASAQIDVSFEQGVMASFNKYLSSTLSDEGILKIGTTSADNEIKQVDTSIQRLQDRLDDKQQRLVAQFARMETLLAQMQAQSNALNSQLAGLISQQGGR
jgi:flagellar hook-associated protein 2